MKKIISNLILIVFIALLMLKYIPAFLGYHLYAIESGSMQPSYSIGSLIFVQECSFEEVEVNDVITFKQASSNVSKTHRVIAIDKDKLQFTTKGDNNQEADAQKVASVALIGKLAYSIPLVGYLYLFFNTTIGIIFIVFLVIITLLLNWKSNNDKKSE